MLQSLWASVVFTDRLLGARGVLEWGQFCGIQVNSASHLVSVCKTYRATETVVAPIQQREVALQEPNVEQEDEGVEGAHCPD